MARLKGLPPRLAAVPRAVGFSAGPAGESKRRQLGNRLRHLYNTARWRSPVHGVRQRILDRANWMCQGCAVPHLLIGRAPAPTSPIVDHIIPHRGNLALFWDEENLQAVCKEYHDGEKQRLEKANHRPA